MQPGEKPGGESAHVLYHKNSGMKLSASDDRDVNKSDNKMSSRPNIVLGPFEKTIPNFFQISFIFGSGVVVDRLISVT